MRSGRLVDSGLGKLISKLGQRTMKTGLDGADGPARQLSNLGHRVTAVEPQNDDFSPLWGELGHNVCEVGRRPRMVASGERVDGAQQRRLFSGPDLATLDVSTAVEHC